MHTQGIIWKLNHLIFPSGYYVGFKDGNSDMTLSLPLSLSLLSPVSIFPPSILTTEVEASPAETTQMTTPLCLTKHSTIDAQTHPELPSSTVLGRPQSPAGLPEGRSEIKRRPQGSSTYFRAKIKVRTERDRAQHNMSLKLWTFKNIFLIEFRR